jgi:hypothetical protein
MSVEYKKTLFAPLRRHTMRCSLFHPGLPTCVVSSRILTEHDTSHGAAEKELENTQQADSHKQAHHTSDRDCEVLDMQRNIQLK